ncbi:MAG: gamma-glutamyl-gamma-aminobutyrate hydrolase family protein [Bacteroidales bacterium]|nr:gamma-glutamyl-gamma-aminobutyrate hydrolase family protein [Bacteroidales bacterium]
MKTKLLVYNIMEYPEKIRMFNEGVSQEIDACGMYADFYIFGKSEKLWEINNYTHLIISGSEASAMDESPWTKELTQLITDFIISDKKILAICYGHQFLVRVLAGREYVFKMPVAEYGYSKIKINKNRLFEGINKPIVLELHYDAVRNLPDEFEIIAENNTCIQAIQYKGRDVFGVQFHPEFDRKAAQYFFDEARSADPEFPSFFHNYHNNENALAQNRLFIRNFLKM